MTFQQLILILRARWRLALSIFVGTVVLAFLLTLIWPEQYTGASSIVIDSNPDPVTVNGAAASDALMSNLVLTEVDILGSERVARRVVNIVKLDKTPKMQKKWLAATKGKGDIVEWAAQYLILKKLTITPTHQSNVIQISVDWYDAEMAAALANAFAQAAMEANIELKVEPAKLYSAWFEARSQELRKVLETKQKLLSDFQNQAGIIATDEKLDVENTRLADLSSQLSAIEEERQGSQSHQRQAGGDNQALTEVLQSPVIQSLKQNLSVAEAKEPDIAARLGKNHPDYQAVEAEISTLREKIAQETNRITASLGNTAQIDVRRETDVRRALDAQKARVLELKHQHDQAAVLLDDVTAAQKNLDAVAAKYSQTALESITQQTNVVQLSQAAVPVQRSSPKTILALALGIFFGGILGAGTAALLELRDMRVRAEGELFDILGVPLLGTIGFVQIGAKRSPRRNRLLGRLEYSAS